MDAFPHLNINVKDESSYVPIQQEILPLHRPLYVMKTERGPVGQPVWCPNMAYAEWVFGNKTFNPLNKEYFSRSSAFLIQSFPFNGAFITRIGHDSMTTGRMLLTVTVPDDETGVYTFALEEEDHTTSYWNEQGMWNNEFVWDAEHASYSASKYPLMLIEVANPGKFGNDYGFQLFSEPARANYDEVDGLNSFLYTFGFVKRDDTFADTISRMKTKYSAYNFIFTSDEEKVHPTNSLEMDFENAMDRYFDSSYPAPARIHMFNANWNTVCKHVFDTYYDISTDEVKVALGATGIYDVDGELTGVTDRVADIYEYVNRINLTNMTIVSENDVPMAIGSVGDPATVAGISLNKVTDHMVTNGSDGDLELATGTPLDNNSTIETQIGLFYNLTTLPAVVDAPKYPFNMIFDTGYSSSVKDEIIDFIAYREDVKIVMSTWFGSGEYDEATVIALANLMTTNIRLTPESELFGTGTFRANIFGQVGRLNDLYYRDVVPLTIWYARAMAKFHNLTYINEQPAGLPNAEVDIFSWISWTPHDKPTKRDLWTQCVNYCQHYDMTHIHFPSLKSVYDNDSSVLSTDNFTNTVIWVKQLTYKIWAKYAGRDDVDLDALYDQVKNDLNKALGFMLNDKYTFETSMYQTEEEARLGYEHHVQIILTGGPGQRVWNLDIICRRTNYEG